MITTIIPTYRPRLLQRAIKSVCAQTYRVSKYVFTIAPQGTKRRQLSDVNDPGRNNGMWQQDTYRATGITAYVKNSGKLEVAQHIANHESPWTTKVYDRCQDEVSLDEVQRIAILGRNRRISVRQ